MVHRFLLIGAVAVGALVTGCANSGDGSNPLPEGPSSAEADIEIAVDGTDRLSFEPDVLTVPAGEQVTLTFSAGTAIDHDFVIEAAADVGTAEADDPAHDTGEDDSDDLHVVHADPGETTTATLQINEPGTYTVYCSVPGHREAGMVATLTAVEAGR
jgi:uncharacterized cupredoxin-like copper-binding protein